jgi:hypothetical protein
MRARMMHRVSGRIALLTLAGLMAGFPAAQSRAEDDVAKQLLGIWRLVSWEQRLADGTARQAPNSVGYIIYTDTGHMCYVGMNPNRPKWASRTPTESEALSAITGLGAYCGTVEFHTKEGFILHRVEIERSPNNVGTLRKRWFTFHSPDRVSLRVDEPELIAPIVESVLTWERVRN